MKKLKLFLLKTSFYFIALCILNALINLIFNNPILTQRKFIILLSLSIFIALYEIFKNVKTLKRFNF